MHAFTNIHRRFTLRLLLQHDLTGALISIYIMAIAIGQVFMTSIGIFVSYFEMNLMSLIIAIVAFFCILATAVESTSWYLMVDNEYEAERSFHYYWNTGTGTDRTQVCFLTLRVQ